MANGIGNQYGQMIKVVRTFHGWTQTKLSQESNVSPRYLSHYENDKEMVSPTHLIRIQDALGVDFEQLRPAFQEFAAAVLDPNGHPAPDGRPGDSGGDSSNSED